MAKDDKTAEMWDRPDVQDVIKRAREVAQNGLKNARSSGKKGGK
jgi:hypothetical protein